MKLVLILMVLMAFLAIGVFDFVLNDLALNVHSVTQILFSARVYEGQSKLQMILLQIFTLIASSAVLVGASLARLPLLVEPDMKDVGHYQNNEYNLLI